MSCRVARFMPNRTQMVTVFCCKCGSADGEVILIASTYGPYLCLSCGQSTIESGMAKEWGTDRMHGLIPS